MECYWITGAAGFIGSHLTNYLLQQGRSQDKPRQLRLGLIGNRCAYSGVHKEASVETVDGRINDHNLSRLEHQIGVPKVIYHLAGGASVGKSISQPYADFQNTVVASGILLEWVRKRKCRPKIVFVSSAAVYGAGYTNPISELDICVPHSPYGHHKYAGEGLFRYYAAFYDFPVSIVRPFSVYGTGLRKQLIYDLCLKLMRSPDKLELSGTGDELRDWLHVDDLVRVLILAVEIASREAPIINACGGRVLSVKEVARYVLASWNATCNLQFTGVSRVGDPQMLVGDPTKLRSFGFRVDRSWREGVEEMIGWVRQSCTVS